MITRRAFLGILAAALVLRRWPARLQVRLRRSRKLPPGYAFGVSDLEKVERLRAGNGA